MNLFEAIRAKFGDEAEAKQTGQQVVFEALHRTRKHIYAGTVDPVEVATRRRANKRARAARRGQTRKLGPSIQAHNARVRRADQVAKRSDWANR